jgi:hypothetical protein
VGILILFSVIMDQQPEPIMAIAPSRTPCGDVQQLSMQLDDMSVSMRMFSLSMRKLYSEHDVSGSDEACCAFRR